MILHSYESRKANAGDIAVYFRPLDAQGYRAELTLIEDVSEHSILIAPFGPLAGEDDDSGHALSIPAEEASLRLAFPELEPGDELLHRQRPAVIIETHPLDWHLRIRYSDSAGGEFYGNIIWMDFEPTLGKLNRDESAQQTDHKS